MSQPSFQRNVILVSGYAQAGKDTYGQAIIESLPPGHNPGVFKFATALREALRASLASLGIEVDVYTEDPVKKAALRPLMVEFGKYARSVDPGVFVKATIRSVESYLATGAKTAIVTDTRYINEYEAFKRWGDANGVGITRIWIERPGHGPANAEEDLSIDLLNKYAPKHSAGKFKDGEHEIIKAHAADFVAKHLS